MTAWCECGWNVDVEAYRPRRGLDGVIDRLMRRSSEAIARQATTQGVSIDAFRLRRAVVQALAIAVHSVTLVILAVGVFVWVAFPRGGYLIFALAALLAWFLRPRALNLPTTRLDRTSQGTLFGVVDQVASDVGASSRIVVTYDGSWNAWFGRAGHRGHPTLNLGLPYFACLDPQERVALIAHELAHSANHDPGRSMLVATALETTKTWDETLSTFVDQRRVSGLIALPIMAIAFAARSVVRLAMRSIVALDFPISVAAELRADQAGARAAGSAAMVRTLHKAQLSHLHDIAVGKCRRFGTTDALCDAIREDMQRVPQREFDRLQIINDRAGHRFDGFHPPTSIRIAAIERLAVEAPRVMLDHATNSRLDAEMRTAEADVSRRATGAPRR